MIKRVRQYYDGNVETEWHRLTQGLSVVEFAATLHLIEKYFPKKGRVIDIGGGPGRYSIAKSKPPPTDFILLAYPTAMSVNMPRTPR